MDNHHSPSLNTVEIRFYDELNDFLPQPHQGNEFTRQFRGTPSVKDFIESIGVPHVEVDLILIDGTSAGFDCLIQGGEFIQVFPNAKRLPVAIHNGLRDWPNRQARFILDVHLGRLTRYLRLLGFDCYYRNDLDDPEIMEVAAAERRVILTRDMGILKHKKVSRGYFVRQIHPEKQIHEVVQRLELQADFAEFTRCLGCNGVLERVDAHLIEDRVPGKVIHEYDEFAQCGSCFKVYWKGSHYDKMQDMIAQLSARV